MTSNILFIKLLNLAIEMDEKEIKDVKALKNILTRESFSYEETDAEVRISFYGDNICIPKFDIQTTQLWVAISDAVEKQAV